MGPGRGSSFDSAAALPIPSLNRTAALNQSSAARCSNAGNDRSARPLARALGYRIRTTAFCEMHPKALHGVMASMVSRCPRSANRGLRTLSSSRQRCLEQLNSSAALLLFLAQEEYVVRRVGRVACATRRRTRVR